MIFVRQRAREHPSEGRSLGDWSADSAAAETVLENLSVDVCSEYEINFSWRGEIWIRELQTFYMRLLAIFELSWREICGQFSQHEGVDIERDRRVYP